MAETAASRRVRALAALAGALCLLAALAAGASPDPAVKRVLVLYMDDPIRPYTVALDRAIRQTFEEEAPGHIDLYTEVLDLDRFSSLDYEDVEARFLKAKYAGRPLDLIMACGTPAANFILKRRGDLFPGAPVDFCLVASEELGDGPLAPGVTGVVTNSREAIRGTLDFALRLHPGTRRVVYVTGTSVAERAALARAKAIFADYEGTVTFEVLDGLPPDELIRRAASLPEDSVVLFHGLAIDRKGRPHSSVDVLEDLRPAMKVPAYGTSDLALGHGIVGGFMPTFTATGRRTAMLGLRILALPPGGPVPGVEEEAAAPYFDWNELHRWDISESALPYGSTVLFREQPLWRARPWLVLGVMAFLAAESLLIVALIFQLMRRRRAEAKALEDGRRLSLAVEAAQLGIWEWRVGDARLWATPDALALHGMQDLPDPKLGQGEVFVHPEDRQLLAGAREKVLRSPGRFDLEYRVIRPDGRPRWLFVAAASYAGRSGRVERLVGATMDVTERMEAENRLRASEERYRAFIAYSTEGVCRYETPEGIPVSLPGEEQVARLYRLAYIAECNDAFAQMFGLPSAEEMVGRSLAEVLPASDPRNVGYLRAFIRSGYRMVDAESYKRDARGNTLCTASSGVGVVEDGKLVRIWSIQRDITARRKAEQEARRMSIELAHIGRVAMMGELAASIAHEINQPLGAILSNAEAAELFLAMNPPALAEVREILSDIRENDQRATEVIRRMRSLLRKHPMENLPVDLNALVQDAARIVLAAALTREVDLRLDLEEGLPPVVGDRVQLQQVIINLVLNAMDSSAEARERLVLVRTTGTPDGKVELSVTDSGAGIPSGALPRLFEPFFTTKRDGLGMGLSIARTIIESHQGRIWAENNDGEGATFRFLVPAQEVS